MSQDTIREAFEAWYDDGPPADFGPYMYASQLGYCYAAWTAAHARILAILRDRKKGLPDTPAGLGEEAWVDEIIDEIEGKA